MTSPRQTAPVGGALTLDEVAARIATRFAGVIPTSSWGETSFFYNPDHSLPRGAYFCTLKDHDGENDRGSHLDRPGVYRLNFGLPAKDFTAIFGPRPSRPGKGGIVEGPWSFTELDVITPHPVYGWMGWVAVLNPTEKRFDEIVPLLDRAYDKAKASFEKRVNR